MGIQNQPEPILKDYLTRIQSIQKDLDAIYLFGSRARGDERPASDYDVLVVLKEGAKKRTIKDLLYNHSTDIWVETGRNISLKIIFRSAFDEMKQMKFSFIQNVLKEGVKLG